MGVSDERIAWLRQRISETKMLIDSDVEDGAWYRFGDELTLLERELDDRLYDKHAWDKRLHESEEWQTEEV